MINETSILELNELLKSNKCAFLTGNGFSMNFDSDFGNLYNNLFTSHKDVIHKSVYEVKSSSKNFTRKFNNNYKNVKQYIRHISENNLHKIFEDALIFAETIKNNKQLIEELWRDKIIYKLTFGLSQIDILNQICEVGLNKGLKYINIEHWTILIYFYFAVKRKNPHFYHFPNNNSFITVLEIGHDNQLILIPESIEFEDVIFNGFTTYYRMLFSIAIFSNGKALDLSMLNNISNLEMSNIKEFLNKFNLLISLNYDNIMENIASFNVEHLHGEFVMNKKEFVYNQSLGLDYDNGYVSFSDILIGDYFIFKSWLPIVNKFSENQVNKTIISYSKKMEVLIQDKFINTIVIFGMNIENDQHVLRNIMLAFFNSQQSNPQIIYCYYNSKEKFDFEKQFKEVITFSEDVNKFVESIEIRYIKTQDILKEYFEKENNPFF